MIDLVINDQNDQEVEKSFDRIAKDLFNNYLLNIQGNRYRLTEIEFYYKSDNHKDSYTHENERQLTKDNWYFHRFKNPEKYKKVPVKGLDLTIGNKNKNIYGGILIRGIKDIKNNDIIDGPGKIVNKIIDILGTDKIDKIVKTNVYNVFEKNKSGIYLEKNKNPKFEVYKCKRKLPKPNSKEKEKFVDRFYKYFIYTEIKKVL